MLKNPFSLTAIMDAIEILTGNKVQSQTSIPSLINQIVGRYFLDSFIGRTYTQNELIAIEVIRNTYMHNCSINDLGTESISDKTHSVALTQLKPNGKNEVTFLKTILALKISKPSLELNVLKYTNGYSISLSGINNMESLKDACSILQEHQLSIKEGTYLGQPALTTQIIAHKLIQ
ncbi:hypothetical protein AB6D11_02685 [Vibrio splendidus]